MRAVYPRARNVGSSRGFRHSLIICNKVTGMQFGSSQTAHLEGQRFFSFVKGYLPLEFKMNEARSNSELCSPYNSYSHKQVNFPVQVFICVMHSYVIHFIWKLILTVC